MDGTNYTDALRHPKCVPEVFVPEQKRSTKSQKVRTNCYEQWMPKHPDACCVFHSYAELYYAALLEADTHVLKFVPQPCTIPLKQFRHDKRKTYTPDVYVLFSDGREVVVELASEESFEDKPVADATEYLEQYGIEYRVIRNADVYSHIQLAHNWLYIVRIIGAHWDPAFESCYQAACAQLKREKALRLDELESFLAPLPRPCARSAAFKMLHNGDAYAHLDRTVISARTEIVSHE